MPDLRDGWSLGCCTLVVNGTIADWPRTVCALVLYKHGRAVCEIYRHHHADGEPVVTTLDGTAVRMHSVLTVVLPCMHHLDGLLVLVDAASRSGRKIRFEGWAAWLEEASA
jgi:hypothetical protein